MKCNCCDSVKFKSLVKFKKFPYINTPVPNSIKIRGKFDDLVYLYCTKCYHTIINPKPKMTKLNNLYENFYSYISPLINKKISPSRDNKFINLVEPWVKRNKDNNKIFEIGCFDGYILSKLKKYFDYHEGYDPSDGALIGQNYGLNIKKKFFDHNSIPRNMFDLIVCRHVIEHIYNPKNFIKNILSIMNDNATLIIETPNFEHFIEKTKTECFSFQHVSCFNYHSISSLFAKFGLVAIKKNIGENLIIFFKKKIYKKSTFIHKINSSAYSNYKKNYLKQKKNINKLIFDNLDKNQKYLVWGAGGYSVSLIYHYGLDTNKILFFVDNNENNLNKKFISLSNEIKLPYEIINNQKKFDFILIASMYYLDIIKQLRKLNISIKVVTLPDKVICI